MLGHNSDFVLRGSHGLSIIPLLLVGDQSSLDEDVVEEDVDDDVVAGVDLTTHPLAVADDVLGIESRPCFAAPTDRLSLFLCGQFFPFPNAEEILLYLPDHLQCLWREFESPPCSLEYVRVNRSLVRDDLFRNWEDLVSQYSLKK